MKLLVKSFLPTEMQCDTVSNSGPAPGPLCVHSDRMGYGGDMETISSEVSTRELRSQLSDLVGRAMYAGERIGVTRNGKLAAVLVSVEDLEALEDFEMSQDVRAYREAKAADDGGRVSLDDVRHDLAS